MRRLCRPEIAFIALTWLFLPILSEAQEPSRQPMASDTCTFVEGKGDFCHPAEKARNFEDYLSIGWTFDPVDGFTIEAGFTYIKPAEHKIKPVWQEVGQLGNSEIRTVQYLIDEASDGMSVVLAERNDGLWIPLMKIAGDLPEPVVLHNGAVIAISRNFGGNVPAVRSWAWVWNGQSPVRLNVEGAVGDAVHKIGPEWGCYSTDMEWKTLRVHTWCWQGEWRNKPSVRHEMDAWFDLENGKLIPKRVELSPIDLPGEESKHWP